MLTIVTFLSSSCQHFNSCVHEDSCTTLVYAAKYYSYSLFFFLFGWVQKDRKVKKIIRRKNWKMKNCKESLEEEETDDEIYFMAMVDLKLVSRVLNMQRIKKDQLISWCHHKLSCISFQNGKIQIKPSSFLFPSS